VGGLKGSNESGMLSVGNGINESKSLGCSVMPMVIVVSFSSLPATRFVV